MKQLIEVVIELLKTRSEDEVLQLFESVIVIKGYEEQFVYLNITKGVYTEVQLRRLAAAIPDYRLAVVLAVDYIAGENWGDDHE